MNRRSFLKGSASAVAMASACGIVARDVLSLSEHVRAARGLSDVIYNIEPMQTPFLAYSEEQLANVIREAWDNGGEPQIITFEDDHDQDDT